MKIGIVGLGYVGLPLAVEFAKKYDVIGFDINEKKVKELKNNIDSTKELSDEDLKKVKINYTIDPENLKQCDFIIVAVPTPVNKANIPDLKYVESSSKILGQNLKKGAIVVFESTVHPGVTEEICAPIIEKESGLKCGVDFKIGYSPERVNPGDKEHTITKIVKVVSGMDEDSLNKIADLYGSIITAGVHKAPTIKVAEASKIIENIQRDVNIGIMNELSVIFNKMGIDTFDVLKAAKTKWNFNYYHPGLVGGHCIGVDPYYLILKSEELGHHPQLLSSARRINNYMSRQVAEIVVKSLKKSNVPLCDSNVYLLGLTFKENVKDYRNAKSNDVIDYLKSFGINPIAVDPWLSQEEVKEFFDVEKKELSEINNADAIVVLSPHREFLNMDLNLLKLKMRNKVFFDIKQSFDKQKLKNLGFEYYSL